MVAAMHALVDDRLVDVSDEVIAERERLGLDTRDEVWEGVLHMNPPPSNEHSRVQHQLFLHLHRLAEPLGLDVRMELGLFNPAFPTPHDFRVPDITVFPPEVSTVRGADGAAAMAVEVRSPGDDSFKKLPYYDAMGVGEVLIIHRDSTWVRRWSRVEGQLVESIPDDGRHRLACVPLVVWSDGDRLFVEVDGVTTLI
jgi:Uma2 family endonuclease